MQRQTRSARSLVTTACAVLALTHLWAATAAAQNPFVIDGNVPASGNPGGVSPTQIDDPFGNVQELGALNGNTTKVGNIHLDAPPTLDFTNPNGQVDLRRVWTQTAKGVDGHLWFYFAWERDANSGSGFIAYEFQQNALAPSCVYSGDGIDLVRPSSAQETLLINSCNPWAGRKPGDFLILWDQQGGGLTITKRVFNGTAFGPVIALGTAVADISDDGFKGEAAIDLTMDVFPAGGACVSFANIIPGTVTGNSDSADYKDTVLSRFPSISNCGSVKVVKATSPAAQTGTFPYTVARQDGSDIKFDGTKEATGTLTEDGDFETILDLKEGANYTLAEGAQTSPWELTSIVCQVAGGTPTGDIKAGGTFSVEGSKLTTCTITNTRRRGSITVIKHVINDNGGTAVATDFTMSLQDSNPTTTPFPGHESPGDTYTFDEGHQFNVTETGPAGYTPSFSGVCSGTIEAGVTKVCTVTNDDNAAHIIVIKHVINDNGGTLTAASFTMTINGVTAIGGNSFAGAEDPGVSRTLSSVGAYSVTEAAVSGYEQTITSAGCSGTIALGETKVCTITNNDLKATPSGATVQRAVLHDRLSVTGIRTGNGPLTATFRLYSDAACAVQVGADETVNVTVNAGTGTATTVVGVTVSASNAYRWRVTFSGNDFNNGFTTNCGEEISTVTFTQ